MVYHALLHESFFEYISENYTRNWEVAEYVYNYDEVVVIGGAKVSTPVQKIDNTTFLTNNDYVAVELIYPPIENAIFLIESKITELNKLLTNKIVIKEVVILLFNYELRYKKR